MSIKRPQPEQGPLAAQRPGRIAVRLARALRALPGWQLSEQRRCLSRLYSFHATECAASFAARVLLLTTADDAPVRCVLAKEGSYVRVTALAPEGGWHAAALSLLQSLDREAEAVRGEDGP